MPAHSATALGNVTSREAEAHAGRAWLLLGITLLALVVRLVGLDTGLWIDEIYLLDRSVRTDLWTIMSTYWGDAHHPLYAILSHLSWSTFGESAWSLRLPALIAGTLGVPMTYALARRVVSSREALAAALLVAVSYHHVWFSQNARGYTLMALFATASTWALLRALETGALRDFVLMAVFGASGAYTHLTMVFVVVAQALVVAVEVAYPSRGRERIDWRRPAFAFVLAGVLTLLLYGPALDEVLNFFLHKPSGLRGVSTPSWALQETFRSLLVGIGATQVVLGGAALAGAVVVFGAGFVSIARRHRNAALAFSLPALTMLAGALAGRGTLYPRFFFFLIGIVLIILVRGVVAVSDWLLRAVGRASEGTVWRVATVGIAAVVVASFAGLGFNYRLPKQDFEGARQHVERLRAQGDRVAFAGVPGEPYRVLYGLEWPTVTSAAELAGLRSAGRTWLVYTFPRYLATQAPGVAEIVNRECGNPAVFRGTLGGGDIFVCILERES